MKILSPQAPEDLYPKPWPQRSLTALGLSTGQIAKFAEHGVTSLGTLEIWLKHNKPSSIRGIGPKTEEQVYEGLKSLRKTKQFAELA